MELLTAKSILLCDEPTSGLDVHNAYLVMDALSKLAKNGWTVLCVVHQPRRYGRDGEKQKIEARRKETRGEERSEDVREANGERREKESAVFLPSFAPSQSCVAYV
jgi:ABC-type multidrug transport system ATPase subunit